MVRRFIFKSLCVYMALFERRYPWISFSLFPHWIHHEFPMRAKSMASNAWSVLMRSPEIADFVGNLKRILWLIRTMDSFQPKKKEELKYNFYSEKSTFLFLCESELSSKARRCSSIIGSESWEMWNIRWFSKPISSTNLLFEQLTM